jgi:F0F1-type ATP synthase epsilon subunit
VTRTGTGRRAFIPGALAEVTAKRVTILAERVMSVAALTGDQIDEEPLQLQTQRDANRDEARRAGFDISIARVEEFKAGLEL